MGQVAIEGRQISAPIGPVTGLTALSSPARANLADGVRPRRGAPVPGAPRAARIRPRRAGRRGCREAYWKLTPPATGCGSSTHCCARRSKQTLLPAEPGALASALGRGDRGCDCLVERCGPPLLRSRTIGRSRTPRSLPSGTRCTDGPVRVPWGRAGRGSSGTSRECSTCGTAYPGPRGANRMDPRRGHRVRHRRRKKRWPHRRSRGDRGGRAGAMRPPRRRRRPDSTCAGSAAALGRAQGRRIRTPMAH